MFPVSGIFSHYSFRLNLANPLISAQSVGIIASLKQAAVNVKGGMVYKGMVLVDVKYLGQTGMGQMLRTTSRNVR